MKITLIAYCELERWIKVRDCCRESIEKIKTATSIAGEQNYDEDEFLKVYDFVSQLEQMANGKIANMIGEEND